MSAAPEGPSPRVAILGTGSMGGAILSGLLADEATRRPVRVTTRSEATAAALVSDAVVATSSERYPSANSRAVTEAEVVILGVKPVGTVALAAEIADAVPAGAVVVSVAAGITTAAIESALPAGTAVVRAMPNTPSTVGRGVTGLARGAAVTDDQLDSVARVFATVGSVHVVPEDRIDALTSISGSGPAYVFLLIDALAAAGVARGLSPELSAALAAETFAGSSALLAASDVDARELRRRVTSPGGTTAKAVEVFEQRDIAGIFDAATAAAAARAAEMSRS